MTVKRVFGDPYERDGITVIPVANVMGGAGGGGGQGMGPQATDGDEAVDPGAGEAGYGAGYGLRATPAGVYVIAGGDVEWQPAVDRNSLILQRTLIAVVVLLTLRSIIRTLAKR